MVTAMLPMLTRSIRIFFTRAQLPHKMRIVIPQHFVKIFDIFIIESLLLDCKTISDMIAQCFMAAAPPHFGRFALAKWRGSRYAGCITK